MTSSSLSWNQNAFGLKEFAELYKYELPVIVKVTQGYCGIDESKYTFCMDDIYHVSHINSQRRIITKDSTGRMLSIPEDYPVQFTRKGSGFFLVTYGFSQRVILTAAVPMRFLEMFQNETFVPGTNVTPAAESKLSFFIGADKQMKTEIQSLELVERFEDHYIVGNPVINGQMYEPAVAIPVFIGIKIVLSNGLKLAPKEKYKIMLEKYKTESLKFKNECVTGNPEIMLYEGEEEEGGEYAFIEPKTYISCAELSTLKKQYQSETPKAHSMPLDYSSVEVLKPADSTFTDGKKSNTEPRQKGFKTLEEVPHSMKGVSIEGVSDCLRLIKMGKHVDTFLENDIDGDLLIELDSSVFLDDLGLNKLEAKKLHMFVHENWRPVKK